MIYLPYEYSEFELSVDMKKILLKARNKFDENTVLLINHIPFKDDVHLFEGFLLFIANKVIFFIYCEFEESKLTTIDIMYEQMKKIFLNNICLKILNDSVKKKYSWLDEIEFNFQIIVKNHVKKIDDKYITIAEVEEYVIENLLHVSSGYKLKELEIDVLLSFFAPEYCIVRSSNEIERDIVLEDDTIYEPDRTSRILRLDSEQINYINKMKKGNELILASAGSGKSVLLIAKAIHISKKNPDEKFLILTYNTNLSEYYNWKIRSSGMGASNLECYTYDMLTKSIVLNTGRKLPRGDNKFDEIKNEAHKIVSSGNGLKIYSGIFIDEAQIFRPEWIDLTYMLLRDSKKEGHYFYLCGDKSQQVNNTIIEKSPWELAITAAGDFDNIHRIDRNYRNTRQINEFLNCFLEEAKQSYQKLNVKWSSDENYFLRGEAYRDGEKPSVIRATDNEIVRQIVSRVKYYLDDLKIQSNDIAIVFHTTKYGRETKLYGLLQKELSKELIDFSLIHGSEKESYSTFSGIAITTIDACLGLDFEAVILCGLENIGKYGKTDQLYQNSNVTDVQAEELYIGVNKLYTALSRARNLLTVFVQECDNWYTSLLLEARDKLNERV